MSQSEANRLLGWIYHRSRNGLFSMKRSERDQALADINHLCGKFQACWDGQAAKSNPNHQWTGEQP
jgi:hypothetical protein